MKCDICGESEATVHLTEIVDNKMTKLHLCEECARKKGAEMEEHFGLGDLLAGLADFGTKIEPDKEAKFKCPSCGMTYEDFKKNGRLGCGKCYSVFEKSLLPLIKRIHGSTEHFGKTPVKLARAAKGGTRKKKTDKLEELKRRLGNAVRLEEFEEAAGLRDKIRELERNK